MLTSDPAVHVMAPVHMRPGTRFGTTTRLLHRATAQGERGCVCLIPGSQIVTSMHAAVSCVKGRWPRRAVSLSDACGMCMQAGTHIGQRKLCCSWRFSTGRRWQRRSSGCSWYAGPACCPTCSAAACRTLSPATSGACEHAACRRCAVLQRGMHGRGADGCAWQAGRVLAAAAAAAARCCSVGSAGLAFSVSSDKH